MKYIQIVSFEANLNGVSELISERNNKPYNFFYLII